MAIELPEGFTQADLNRLAQLSKGARALKEEFDALNSKLKTALIDAGYYTDLTKAKTLVMPDTPFGTLLAKIGVQKRFAPKEFEAEYPYGEETAEYYTPQVDSSRVPESIKKQFTPATPTISLDVSE